MSGIALAIVRGMLNMTMAFAGLASLCVPVLCIMGVL